MPPCNRFRRFSATSMPCESFFDFLVWPNRITKASLSSTKKPSTLIAPVGTLFRISPSHLNAGSCRCLNITTPIYHKYILDTLRFSASNLIVAQNFPIRVGSRVYLKVCVAGDPGCVVSFTPRGKAVVEWYDLSHTSTHDPDALVLDEGFTSSQRSLDFGEGIAA